MNENERLCDWCNAPFESKNPRVRVCSSTHGAQLAAQNRFEAKMEEERRREAAELAKDEVWKDVVFPSYKMKPATGRVDRPATQVPTAAATSWAAKP